MISSLIAKPNSTVTLIEEVAMFKWILLFLALAVLGQCGFQRYVGGNAILAGISGIFVVQIDKFALLYKLLL